MILKFEKPECCNDCIFCYDNMSCSLADKRFENWCDDIQSFCPFDNKGQTISNEIYKGITYISDD